MKKYESYKPANLPWLDEVPSHWQMMRNKVFLTESKETVGDAASKYKLLSLTLNGIIPRDITSGKGKFPSDYSTYKIIRSGDIVFCLFDIDETPRTVGLSAIEGMLTGAYSIFHIANINPRFLYYYYTSLDNVKALKPLYTGLRKTISTDTFLDTKMPVPPRSEQNQIVRYLDWQVSKINKLITVKKKQITLLNEQKEAIIYNTVTKGLDPNVPMKNSRIEWVNTLPIAWNKDKVVRLFKRIGSGTTPSSGNLIYYNDGTIPWINSGDLYSDSMYLDGTERAVSQKAIDDYSILKIYPANTIVIAMYGASIGNLAISRIRACCNQACCCLSEIDNRLDIIYAYYLFKACKSYWIKKSQGGGQPNISQDIIKQTWLPLPPRAEQFKITHFLCEYESSINKTIDNIQFEIRLLQELRIRLISDVATGQIDVRGIEIPEYESVEEDFDEESDDEIDGNPYSEEVSDELEME